MARGPKKHLKRLNAPSHWMLSKMGGIFAPRPSAGPHKLRECLPLMLILRNRLKYALTRKECTLIVMRRFIQVDGKVRSDINYPAGFQDVLHIAKTNETFRLLYDTRGRFVLHKINDKEAKFKLLRVVKVGTAKKATIGTNPFVHGVGSAISFLVTHDGRTVRYPDPAISVNDVVKFDLTTGKIVDRLPFDVGALAMVTKGANTGRVGAVIHREKHPGSYEIVHLKDRKGHEFATRVANVFIVGKGDEAAISLPQDKGVKLSILEQRTAREAKAKRA
jgi:small subunit ribosomal protein S4e